MDTLDIRYNLARQEADNIIGVITDRIARTADDQLTSAQSHRNNDTVSYLKYCDERKSEKHQKKSLLLSCIIWALVLSFVLYSGFSLLTG